MRIVKKQTKQEYSNKTTKIISESSSNFNNTNWVTISKVRFW